MKKLTLEMEEVNLKRKGKGHREVEKSFREK
jgi:hypothetical protein